MNTKLLSSTAALAILLATPLAQAQTSPPAASAPSAQPSNPSQPAERTPSAAPEQRGQEPRAPKAGTPSRQGGDRGDRSSQREAPAANDQGGRRQQDQRAAEPRDQGAPTRSRQESQRPADRNERQTRGDRERGGERDRSANTGAAPATSVEINTEQRTRIRERREVFRSGRVDRVNFSLSVGTSVPRSQRIYVLPPEIVEFVPRYRGYKYILVGDEVVIIDPRTLRIVAVIEA
ncbi:hypothetical protein GJW-30_1_00571 [Variibacter gotjawalensis]|uniref:DUF1236 domain-containing protein n=1 Tax=Variibacter gotjawalensis TaxID=1333996 RepID=A0A0S3PQ62_9BRAD|nr:DUF1236 domain-containing protein [Variibacter gotjawalensis]NIK48356.1 type IV secretory pathway VirB10-like protein [Variibacter gotjawalensis]RZS50226.1 uncharacterized protein DUF1236 [Variibacter gotjawalensis]BAT58057.1 hypothetical protein GJW-30_1_00571 [Variibacter gotjawalensis]